MKAGNHLTGGLAFTGIFASFHDINIFAEVPLLTGTLLFSQLPDIDHTRSIIGKAFFPIARWTSRRFGHRTITHSLPFFIVTILIVACIEKVFFHSSKFWIVSAYALGSHLIFDACTVQGIPLMYPFSRAPFVVPANPKHRISVNDYRTEVVIFLLFSGTLLFCRPLFANGFWTQYNRVFATWEHAERERVRNPHAIEVVFTTKSGVTQTGIFIRQEGTKNIILDRSKNLLVISEEEAKIQDFHSTRWKVYEKQIQLFNVTADSLNRWLRLPCLSAQVQSLSTFFYFDGPLLKSGTFAEFAIKKGVSIHVNSSDSTHVSTQIQLKQLQKQDEQTQYLQQCALRSALRTRLLQLQNELPTASNFRKGEIIAELPTLETKIRNDSEPVAPNLKRYDLEIDLLKQSLKPQTLNASLVYVSIY